MPTLKPAVVNTSARSKEKGMGDVETIDRKTMAPDAQSKEAALQDRLIAIRAEISGVTLPA